MNQSPPKKRSSPLLKLLGLIIIPILIFFTFLPSLISTSWGTKLLTQTINSQIPGKIKLQTVHLQWFGGQELTGIELRDPEGNVVVDADRVYLDTTLMRLIMSRIPIGQTTISAFNATLSENEQGVSNLQRSLGKTENPVNPKHILKTPIYLRQVNGQVVLPNDGMPLSAHIKGDTSQGNLTGHFVIDTELHHVNLEDMKSLKIAEGATGTLKIQVENFPVPILDQFSSIVEPQMAGIFQAALGETLNLSIDNTLANSGIGFKANFKTTNLNGQLEGLIKDTSFFLTAPEKITWKISPVFLSMVVPEFPLEAPMEVSFDLKGLTVPLDKPFNWKALFLEGQLSTGDLSLGPEPIHGFHVDFNMPKSVEVTHFPIAIIDHLKSLNGLALAALGAEGKAKITFLADNIIDLQLQTEKLSLASLPLRITNQMELAQPIALNYLITPSLIQKLTPSAVNLKMKEDVSTLIKIKSFTLPLNGSWQKGTFDSDLSFSSITFDGVPPLGDSRLTNLKFKTQASSFQNINFQFNGDLESFNREGITPEVLGGILAISLNGNVGLDSNNALSVPLFQGTASSKNGRLAFAGKYEASKFHLTTPAELTYTLSPKAMRDFGLAKEGQPLLEKPTTVNVSISNQNAVLGKGLEGLQLLGKMTLSDLLLSHDGQTIASLSNLVIPWEIDAPNNTFNFELTGKTSNQESGKKGSIDAHVWVKNWIKENALDFKNLNINSQATIDDLPIALLIAFAGNDDLLHLIGSSVDSQLNTQIQLGEHPFGNVSLALNTPLLTASADLTIKDNVTLSPNGKPAIINWKLTPEGFSRLRQKIKPTAIAEDGLALSEPTLVQLKIASVNLPLSTLSPLAVGGITANVVIDSLSLNDKRKNINTSFENIQALLSSENLSDSLSFHLSAQDVRTNKGKKSTIAFDGFIQHLFDEKGKFNPNGLAAVAEAQAQALPVVTLADLLLMDVDMQKKMDALIGDMVDVQLNLNLNQLNGTVEGLLKGNNGRVSIGAELLDGVVSLTKPFEAEVAITEKLRQNILQEILPLLKGIKPSQQRINITIDPQGVSIPINPFNIAKTQISNATLNIGKVEFLNEGQLGTVLNLLKPVKTDYLSAWFTPIYFGVKKGVVKVERADMLINDTYPFATWGKVDLVKDKVDMVIGISGYALNYALRLGLEDDDMLQIPVTGTIATASLDKARATTRISALIAQSKGGIKGKIFGTILSLATDGGESKVPDPSTNPFPWGKLAPIPGATNSSNANGAGFYFGTDSSQGNSNGGQNGKRSSRNSTQDVLEQGASHLLDLLTK